MFLNSVGCFWIIAPCKGHIRQLLARMQPAFQTPGPAGFELSGLVLCSATVLVAPVCCQPASQHTVAVERDICPPLLLDCKTVPRVVLQFCSCFTALGPRSCHRLSDCHSRADSKCDFIFAFVRWRLLRPHLPRRHLALPHLRRPRPLWTPSSRRRS